MELKAAGFKGRYLAEYLAVGEAPDEIRNVCRQRSRWTKGHMQVRVLGRGSLSKGVYQIRLAYVEEGRTRGILVLKSASGKSWVHSCVFMLRIIIIDV